MALTKKQFTRLFRDREFTVTEYRVKKTNQLATIQYTHDHSGRRLFISFSGDYLWQICPWPLNSGSFCFDSRELGFKPRTLDEALDQIIVCEAENFK